MSDMQVPVVPSAPEAPALTQMQRVIYTFTSPSKTFNDLRRNTSWWMPFLILAVFGYLLFAVVATKVGVQQVVDNQIHLDPKAEARMAQTPPDQKEMAAKVSLYITEGVFIANPVLVLIIAAVVSLVLWATINFGFGGKAKFWSIFAVWMFANLPSIVKTLLGSIVILAGMDPESFNIKNFAPTNAAAIFLNPVESNKALYSIANSLDFVTIWCLVLMSIGIAAVAGVKRSSGYISVFGWWALIVLCGVGWAAVMG
jgi:hypothetical protein